MSADEFDPAVERAYRAPMSFVDSPLFEAEIAVRLQKRVVRRRRIVAALGVLVGYFTLSQFVSFNIKLGGEGGSLFTILERKGETSVLNPAMELARDMGLSGYYVGSLGEAQVLMLVGGAISLVLVATAIRLANSL